MSRKPHNTWIGNDLLLLAHSSRRYPRNTSDLSIRHYSSCKYDRGHGKFLKEITLRQPEERGRVLFGHVIDLDLFESEEQEKLKRLLAGLEESCERADDEMRWNLYVNFDRLGWEDVFDYLTGSGLVLVTAKPAHI
ncbi:uncharacterized protein RAG0_07382 [Rhynchosporium agropyri]|uniref:Uncharacterized protein n=1 Tax=Rhynchosporium agropyri TaxID=914238 RepID=A0A1E1KPK2_9HELO|nr:uncharacterized protein RAG0_07382 [Rhynchosporium agropyri]